MSTSADRLAAIQAIYFDALNNEAEDLSDADTPALVAAVQANLANARNNYYAAAAAALSNDGANIEAAFTAAQNALATVKQARAKSEQIADLLGSLNNATAAGTKLLGLAKAA